MTQPDFIGADLEPGTLEEFISELEESQTEIESLLVSLEESPENELLLNDLFRQVHTIKGNAHIIGLDAVADFVHALENVLDKVRKKFFLFNKQLGDIILMSLDLVSDMSGQLKSDIPVDNKYVTSVKSFLGELSESSGRNYSAIVEKFLIAIKNRFQPETDFHPHLASLCDHKGEDLRFFKSIALNSESRSPLWTNRTARLLQFASAMNRESGFRIKQEQLEAAVYLHDFGMSFLPLDILHKSGNLKHDEFNKIKLHPQLGNALLSDNEAWKEASEIILQHHEREDGKGYPKGITGDKICEGAKLLAIADTYESLTNKRAHRTEPLTLAHVVAEINNCAGSQFCHYWISVFNNTIRQLKVKKNPPSH